MCKFWRGVYMGIRRGIGRVLGKRAARPIVDVVGGGNSAPVISGTINPSFPQGVGSVYELSSNVTDTDVGDTLTYAISNAGNALPTGVTLNPATGTLTYDGAGPTSNVTGIIFTVTDGTDTATSPTFSAPITGGLAAPDLSSMPSAFLFTIGTGQSINLDQYNTGGVAASWAGSSLPSGLTVSSNGNLVWTGTGSVSSTPNGQITATNATDSDTATITSNIQGAGAQAWSYIGVPYPTDPVPSATMPTLPTGADFNNHEWVNTYDPCTIARPTPPATVTLNIYVVDENAGNATDSDQGDNAISGTVYGTTARPRVTPPPAGTYPAGTQIHLFGDGTPLPTSESTNRKRDYTNWGSQQTDIILNGTSASPCWVVGHNNVRVETRNLNISNSTHVIFDAFYSENEPGTNGGQVNVVNSQYICYRNGGQFGRETTSGGQFFQMDGESGNLTDFVVYYNNECAYGGDYNEAPGGTKPNDWHGFRPQNYCRHLWAINNVFHHLSGDPCQVNNSNTASSDYAFRPHFVYFAGNTAYRIKENMFDAKNSFHCIVSQNTPTETEEDSILISNNAEGDLTSYHWALCNIVTQTGTYGTGGGIRDSGDQSNEFSYIIGNFVHDIDGNGLAVNCGTNGSVNGKYFLYNTVVRCTTGFRCNVFQPVNDTTWELDVQGNAFYDCDNEVVIQNAGNNDMIVSFDDNSMFDPTGGVSVDFGGQNVTETNRITADHLFANPAGSAPADFLPGVGSPLLSQTGEHPAIAEFQALYGIDIREDLLNITRSAPFDVGALERTA